MSQQTANKVLIAISLLVLRSSASIGIPMGSDPAPFLSTYSYTLMKVSG